VRAYHVVFRADHSRTPSHRVPHPVEGVAGLLRPARLRSAQEVFAFLTALKQLLEYLDVSDCNMEEGSLRAEANVSIRPKGAEPFGTKTEIKNVASFSGVVKAIDYEIARQIDVLKDGGKIVQETRGWDADRGITFPQRQKESAHDYRYFPEPDLMPVVVDEAWEQRIRASLPEFPAPRRKRFESEYQLSAYDAMVLTSTRAMADYFEAAVCAGADPKLAANWIQVDLQSLLAEAGAGIADCRVTPAHLAEMITLITTDVISGKMAKGVLAAMFESGKAPKTVVEEQGLVQISDSGEIEQVVRKVLTDNPSQLEQYKAGKTKVVGFLVGQIMRATQGKANPKLVNDIMMRLLYE